MVRPAAVLPCVFAVLAAAARGQHGEVFRVEARPSPSVVCADGRLEGRVDGPAPLDHGMFDLRDRAARVTFGPDPRLGVEDGVSFTLEVELRTDDSGFATPLMCRAGDAVHYSIVVGRARGCASFETWGWARERATSRTRIDDGAWHRLRACYDAERRVIVLEVDGVVEAITPVRTSVGRTSPPSLRLGNNLDPRVDQPFEGLLRDVALRRGVPESIGALLEREERDRVLAAGDAERGVRAWNDAHRPRRAAWTAAAEHAARVRRVRALVQDALGLWPPPFGGARRAGARSPLDGADRGEPTAFAAFRPTLPLDVREGGALERDGYRVVRTYWRTFERYWAGGWLYEPTGAVEEGSRSAVLCPHGHWSDGARHPVVQARCITLARRGHVVLAVDSLHVEDGRVALSPVAAMTWANLRGLELLRARDDVDPARIGATGASGGGQQTYYLTALDSGLAAAVPAVMVCHLAEILDPDHVHCGCNHTPHLARVLDVPEMSAAFAPRPQLFLSVTRDWTHAFPRQGYPPIAALYTALGAGDRVGSVQWDKGHDYDRPMRNAMYAFFERWLRGVDDPDPACEPEDLAVEPVASLRALDRDDLPRDVASIAAEFRARLAVDPPDERSAEQAARARLGRLLGAELAGVEVVPVREGAFVVAGEGDVALPALRIDGTGSGVAVVVAAGGKSRAATYDPELRDVLRARFARIWFADVRYTGELDVGHAYRDLHGRFFGLDEGQLAVRDVRRLVAAASAADAERVAVVALGWTGAAALLASALEPRIGAVLAPDLGPTFREADRRPKLARILLYGDLPEAVLASHAEHIVLGGSPSHPAWVGVDARRGRGLRRAADALVGAALHAAVREL